MIAHTDGVVAFWTLLLALLEPWQIVAWAALLYGTWLRYGLGMSVAEIATQVR